MDITNISQIILSLMNLVLLAANLVFILIIFYVTVKERPARRWIKALIFSGIASFLCILIDGKLTGVIAFIGFYAFVFTIVCAAISIFFAAKHKFAAKKAWFIGLIISIILVVISFALTGMIAR